MSEPADAADATESTVRLLSYSDVESAYDDPARVGALAGRIEALRDDRTLVVGAGDDTALGTLSLLTETGRAQALPFFEAVTPDADTFGNHDFDYGPVWALEWAERVPATYCCANLAGDGVATERVPDGTVFERGGARVGVVGLAHPDTPDICGVVDPVEFTDPAAAARDAFAGLEPLDHRVVLSHCGAGDAEIAAAVDADVIVGGHLHNRHTERVDGTLVARTAGAGTEIAEISLGDEPTVAFHEIRPASGSGGGTDTGAAADGGVAAGDATDGPFDPAVAGAYRDRRASLGLDEVVARVDGSLPRTQAERFGGESRLGNFCADAFRAAPEADGDSAADVGLFPAGSLRTGEPLSGAVTRGEVVSLCPFDGDVLTCELDGAALREVLTEAAHPHPGDRGWVQFHVSGLRAVWTDADEVRAVAVGGEPLERERTYRVATAEYAVVIDDFAPLSRDAVVAEHDPQWKTLLAHARDEGLDVECEGRIDRVAVDE